MILNSFSLIIYENEQSSKDEIHQKIYSHMKKPPKGSNEVLTSEKLCVIMKTRNQWRNSELLELLMPMYTAYDQEGLGHRMRQILSECTKKGLIKKVETGIYSTTL